MESLSDAFEIGKVHLAFATYDLTRPAGQRQTNNIHIYIAVDEFLDLCRKIECGELRYMLQNKGLIVPKFGNKPENHVSISMSFESFSEMMLLTKEHFRAWLSAWYSLKIQSAGNQKSFYTSEEQTPENDFAADYDSQPMF